MEYKGSGMLAKFVVCTWILWMGANVQQYITWRPIQTMMAGERSAHACVDLLNRLQLIHPKRTFQCLPEGTVPDGYQPPHPVRLR
jgi:hypothetical protein